MKRVINLLMEELYSKKNISVKRVVNLLMEKEANYSVYLFSTKVITLLFYVMFTRKE